MYIQKSLSDYLAGFIFCLAAAKSVEDFISDNAETENNREICQ